MLPGLLDISSLEVVDGKLQLLGQANISVGRGPTCCRIDRPNNFVDAIHILQKRRDPLQSIGQLRRDGIQIDSPGLLEVGELRYLKSVQHDLPADSPSAEGRRLPVVFLELDVMLAQINPNRTQRLQVQLLYVLRRRLQDHL